MANQWNLRRSGMSDWSVTHEADSKKDHSSVVRTKYEAEDRGSVLLSRKDSFQLCTKREMYDHFYRIENSRRNVFLTDVLLETLPTHAYQLLPVTKT